MLRKALNNQEIFIYRHLNALESRASKKRLEINKAITFRIDATLGTGHFDSRLIILLESVVPSYF